MKNIKGALGEDIHLLAAISVIILALGCIGASPGEQSATSTLPTVQPLPYMGTTLSTASSLSTPEPTLSAAGADKEAICLEAKANKTQYERCKLAASGSLPMPQSELQRCAEIQQHAGAYSELIFHGLQNCVGIPAGGLEGDTYTGAYFCKDLGQPDRDQCYLSVRMCGSIEDSGLKSQCTGSLELKKL